MKREVWIRDTNLEQTCDLSVQVWEKTQHGEAVDLKAEAFEFLAKGYLWS